MYHQVYNVYENYPHSLPRPESLEPTAIPLRYDHQGTATYTLHPIPCTLHPTPYTLYPTPYTLRPTPHTLHPTPYTVNPTPYTIHRTPCTTMASATSLDMIRGVVAPGVALGLKVQRAGFKIQGLAFDA